MGGGGATKRERASEVLPVQKKGGARGRTSFSLAEGGRGRSFEVV